MDMMKILDAAQGQDVSCQYDVRGLRAVVLPPPWRNFDETGSTA